jgi:hypothetical protein
MTRIIRIGVQAAIAVVAMLGAVGSGYAAGAIAIGRCDRSGYSYDYANGTLARQRALAECAKNGDQTCRIVVNTRRNCGAFAVDGRCGARGWGFAPSRRGAEAIALAQCSGHGGRNCSVRTWTCDGGP